ncbi:imidazolonepropionase [Caloramator quimbayensis]|uniref:Imidazolonepropionase n=1 Tax=Caloramator quimbayensis TaxID=1147123 RepID=A0A1T4WRN0_9CLOT|nr:imidazolonepropionase [Caloramator quimbayensis]SKA79757.1 imidazolonepropionase [Caloramator quimbayensis]
MADIIIKNARILTCKSNGPKIKEHMQDLGIIERGFIAVENGIIQEVGEGDGEEFCDRHTEIIDAEYKTVLPGFVDPHTHLVHYGSRENEIELKLKGVPYIEILKMGGGILSTVRATRAASYDQLMKKMIRSLDIMLLWGTTTVEAKSGYGLNFVDEVKCLEVLRDCTHPVEIIRTYMGAHAVPEEYKDNREGYINLMTERIIPYVAEKELAEFIDCFCEEGVFSVEESERILLKGKEHGLKIKIHADEIEPMGGAELAGRIGAVSAEHLIAASDEGIEAMKEGGVIPVLLPGTSFYLRLGKYARGRKMIDMGLPVALATDYNPGTCPTESLQGIMVFASMGMGLTPQEVINAMTINSAYAIDRGDKVGSIEKGKNADILIMDAPNENYIIYHFGINHVNTVIKNGKIVVKEGRLCY